MVVGEKKLVDVLTDSPRELPLEQAVCPKSSAVSGLYGRLSIGLVRANARALLARSSSLS